MFNTSLNNSLGRGNKEEITTWGIPDYTAAVSISSLPYTVEENGYYSTIISLRLGASYALKINNVQVMHMDNANNGYVSPRFTVPVKKGDVITETYAGDVGASYKDLFPLVGVE